MGFYWRRSTKLFPGVRINWSKSGPSLSVGPRGAKLNFSKRGTYASGGIPGTGMYYRQKIGGKKRQSQVPNNSSYDSSNNGNTIQNQAINTKGCMIVLVSIIGLALLFSGNYITCLLFVFVISITWLLYNKFSGSSLRQNNSAPSSQQVSPQASKPQPTSANQVQQQDAESVEIKVAIAEVEHLIKEIDNCSDKVKLPSFYRKLMSIIGKLERYGTIEIQGLPIEEVKRRVLENYRRKMN